MSSKRPDEDEHAGRLTDLLRTGPASAPALCGSLGISQPTFSRLVARMPDLAHFGRGRATQYFSRRSIVGIGDRVPLYEALTEGSRALGVLHAARPDGFVFESTSDDADSGWSEDLPWFMSDLRPAGFLGRLVPRIHGALGLPDNITLWSGDHCLRYLVQAAWNTPGSLLAGDEAFRRYAAQTEPPFADAVAADGRAERYAAIAEDVLQRGVAGSSAAGEQPKFLATRAGEGGPTPVIVKFSPPATDALGTRVADLLVAEHLAVSLLSERGLPAAATSLHHARGRTFLEVERFDRVGTAGRRGVASLMALDRAFVGKLATWPETTEALLRQRLISAADHRRVRWLHLFGRLIANSDMHLGNLSFFLSGARVRELCPAYDMTPMLYAPQGNELVERAFQPPPPAPSEADLWPEVQAAAEVFWQRVSADPRISGAFRTIAAENAARLARLSTLAALLPGVR
jgi:hypothetical protein